MTGKRGATILHEAMEERGFSARRLAQEIEQIRERGEHSHPSVSESAIRTYLQGAVPRIDKAVSIAWALREHAVRLLKAWGYLHSAKGFETVLQSRYQGGTFYVHYPGPELSLEQVDIVLRVIRGLQQNSQDVKTSSKRPSKKK